MAKNDDKDDIVFPTRFGGAVGASTENRMIFNAQGHSGIVTRVRKNDDGSVVRLRTRGGFPDFVREEARDNEQYFQYRYAYGLVDTSQESSDSSSDPLQVLVDETGAIQGEQKTLVKNDSAWKQWLIDDLPTNYSGLMRRVVQVRHGAFEKKAASEATGVKKRATLDDFSSTYALSHGLYVDSVSGQRWVIEIDEAGIYRVPIGFMQDLLPESGGGWEAHENSVFSENTYEDAVSILSPYWDTVSFRRNARVKIGDAPACYAGGYVTWYPWCGWAFSYDGTKATIVCMRADPADVTWVQTSLFDVTIVAVDGVPQYATSAVSETSRLATNYIDTGSEGCGIFQVADTSPGVCVTFALHKHDAPPLTAPVFSFYTPSGEKRVYFYSNYAENDVDSIENNETNQIISLPQIGNGWINPVGSSGNTRLPASGVVNRSETGYRNGGFGFSGGTFPDGTGAYDLVVSDRKRFPISGGYIVFATTAHYTVGYTPFAGGDTYYADFSYGGGLNAAISLQCSGSYDEIRSNVSETRRILSSVIIHGYDREAIAFAVNDKTTKAAHSVSIGDGIAVFGGTVLTESDSGIKDYKVGEPLNPSVADYRFIAGVFDYSGVSGYGIAPASALRTGPGLSFPYAGISVSSRSEPASTTESTTLYVEVGDFSYSVGLESSELLQVYEGGASFSFRVGHAAFSYDRLFFSDEANAKPSVKNIGSYARCVRGINNFIGVF